MRVWKWCCPNTTPAGSAIFPRWSKPYGVIPAGGGTGCHLTTYLADNFRIALMARDVPGIGYRAYRLANVPVDGIAMATSAATPAPITALENEWLRVEANPEDGTLTVTDKATGRTLTV